MMAAKPQYAKAIKIPACVAYVMENVSFHQNNADDYGNTLAFRRSSCIEHHPFSNNLTKMNLDFSLLGSLDPFQTSDHVYLYPFARILKF